MSTRQILLLGNPRLYESSEEVNEQELESLKSVVADLHDTLMVFRKRWGAGRAIAAPQVGVMKRLIYMYIERPFVFINPRLEDQSKEMFEVWDDCMSFPELLIKVRRHQSCRIVYRDMSWQLQSMNLDSDLSELLQHEIDHLDGILSISRAIDGTAFALRSQAKFTDYDRSGLPEAI
ncbi:MAG: peptide deformylase [Cyanobacteria bacterium P01_D01_bin.105]